MAVAEAAQPDDGEPQANLPAESSGSHLPAAPGRSAANAPRAPLSQRARENFNDLSRGRQVQLIAGLAVAVAIGVVIFLWSHQSTYKLLYGNLSDQTAAEVVEVLKQEAIPYRLDEQTGEIMVPPDRVHDVRILLAGQGLPKDDGGGFEVLKEQNGFGTSQFMEKARFHRALEGELARTITRFENVESSRVHLAIPKQSVFVRNRQEPTASVLVHLRQGRGLDQGQVAAIVHMVASSIPELKADNVTVVDQTGKMLTTRHLEGDMSLSAAQFDYKRKLENHYVERIERILMPIVGFNGVRAEVDAEVDFSLVEKTEERYNPDLPALRSEQTVEENSKGGDVGGVPGALTNQPPGDGEAPETLPDGQGGQQPAPPERSSRRATYNYELDKTISHTKEAPGSVERLSVAVVVDDKVVVGPDGSMTREPLTPEELDRITGLVREAVGLSPARGDSLNVINASFQDKAPLPAGPTGPVWEQPWFIDIAKQAGGALIILLLVYLLVRPVVKALLHVEPEPEEPEEASLSAEELEADEERRRAAVWAERLSSDEEDYQKMLAVLREMVQDDPKLVAQVVKTWVAEDEPRERQPQ